MLVFLIKTVNFYCSLCCDNLIQVDVKRMLVSERPDEGYAWVILAASFVGNALDGGVVFCQALMYQVFLTKFGMTAADTGAIGATYAALLFLFSKCYHEF